MVCVVFGLCCLNVNVVWRAIGSCVFFRFLVACVLWRVEYFMCVIVLRCVGSRFVRSGALQDFVCVFAVVLCWPTGHVIWPIIIFRASRCYCVVLACGSFGGLF